MMSKLNISFEVVTPLFMSAFPKGEPEIRAGEIKGMIRFWHRAIDPNYADNETAIFGGTERHTPTMKIRIIPSNPEISCLQYKRDEKDKKTRKYIPHDDGKIYLGYGALDKDTLSRDKDTLSRQCIPAGTTFTMDITFASTLEKQYIAKFFRATQAMSLFGGVGGRSRRGFGSLNIQEMHGDVVDGIKYKFNNGEEYIKYIREFIQENYIKVKNGEAPNHTCISNRAIFIAIPINGDAATALEIGGRLFKEFRSYKNEDLVGWSDHELILPFIKKNPLKDIPRRVAFGLPHNYHFTNSIGASAELNYIENEKKGRRASPLLLHIQKIDENTSCILFSFLPAQFLPAKKEVTISYEWEPRFTSREIYNNDGFKQYARKVLNDNGITSLGYAIKMMNAKILWKRRNEKRSIEDQWALRTKYQTEMTVAVVKEKTRDDRDQTTRPVSNDVVLNIQNEFIDYIEHHQKVKQLLKLHSKPIIIRHE